MTIIESIVQFLNQYEKEKIGVDKLGSSTMSYSLMKEPQENVQRFISGLEVHTDYYQLAARRMQPVKQTGLPIMPGDRELQSGSAKGNRRGNIRLWTVMYAPESGFQRHFILVRRIMAALYTR